MMIKNDDQKDQLISKERPSFKSKNIKVPKKHNESYEEI